MKDQISNLNQLLKKYKSDIENLEKELKEKKEKMKVVYGALELLKQEGALQSTQSISAIDSSKLITESLSDKYKGLSLNKAILDRLSNSDKYLDGNEIFDELIKNGFSSGSSDIKRDVYISLYRLEKTKKIVSKSVENRKKYIIKQNI